MLVFTLHTSKIFVISQFQKSFNFKPTFKSFNMHKNHFLARSPSVSKMEPLQ